MNRQQLRAATRGLKSVTLNAMTGERINATTGERIVRKASQPGKTEAHEPVVFYPTPRLKKSVLAVRFALWLGYGANPGLRVGV